MKRSVGYCVHMGCPLYSQGAFLLNHHKKTFECPRCKRAGQIQHESGYAQNVQPIFKEVRLSFDYNPANCIYRTIAVIIDESLTGLHNVYHYASPMIKTEKQALKSAESMLATLNQMTELPVRDELPNWYESRISWDDSPEIYEKRLVEWSESLKGTPLSRS